MDRNQQASTLQATQRSNSAPSLPMALNPSHPLALVSGVAALPSTALVPVAASDALDLVSDERATLFLHATWPATGINQIDVRHIAQWQLTQGMSYPMVKWAQDFYSSDVSLRRAAHEAVRTHERLPVLHPALPAGASRNSSLDDEDDEELAELPSSASPSLLAHSRSPGKRASEQELRELRAKVARLQQENQQWESRFNAERSRSVAALNARDACKQDKEALEAQGRSLKESQELEFVWDSHPKLGVVEMMSRPDAQRLATKMIDRTCSADRATLSELASFLRLSDTPFSMLQGAAKRSMKKSFLSHEVSIDMDMVRCDKKMAELLWGLCVVTGQDRRGLSRNDTLVSLPGYGVGRKVTGQKTGAMQIHWSWSTTPTAATQPAADSASTQRTFLSPDFAGLGFGSPSLVPHSTVAAALSPSLSRPRGPAGGETPDPDSDDDMQVRTDAFGPSPTLSRRGVEPIQLPDQRSRHVDASPSPPIVYSEAPPVDVRPPDAQRVDRLLGGEETAPADEDTCASDCCDYEALYGHRGGALTQCDAVGPDGLPGCGSWFHWTCERPEAQPCSETWQCRKCSDRSGWKPKSDEQCLQHFKCVCCDTRKPATQFPIELLPRCGCTGDVTKICAKCTYGRIEATSNHRPDEESDVPIMDLVVSCSVCRMEKTHIVGRDGSSFFFKPPPSWLTEEQAAAYNGTNADRRRGRRPRRQWEAALAVRHDEVAVELGPSGAAMLAADGESVRIGDDGRPLPRQQTADDRRARMAQKERQRQRDAERAARAAEQEAQASDDSNPFEFDEPLMGAADLAAVAQLQQPQQPGGPQLMTLGADGVMRVGVPDHVGY